ncbi:hypothetical protein BBO99_00003769 [Phytophthora kernoviae]|uniref:Protein kinase domain-containing protein n=1 Tax=Phytophthora kernoviae TaxID=325452 RepID=A0A421GTG9_9STRA|nr:hypothetical protein BBI17_003831 [Phytophthora kernoviae]RLN81358.1 hypothetical protein BBO99_00003769 [Phytophthora kernoviae]
MRQCAVVLALTLALLLAVCHAVNVGEMEESSCPNVTTVSIYSSSSSNRRRTLDLRKREIAAVESLPRVDIVRLDNNQLQSFATTNNITELYLANNSITMLTDFTFPDALTVLDLANNDLGDIDGVEFSTSLQYLNLSGNAIGFLNNISFPSSLLHLDMSDSSIASLENLSFPSTVTTLNFSGNPITLIKGVIFPASLTELALTATAKSTTTTTSVITPEEARTLQTGNGGNTVQSASVLQEFEVRQSDADMFEKLSLWDVSTTSTLSCSDSDASPRYVQDTMLCVLSDNEFAAKYEEVVLQASSGSTSMWGVDESSGQAIERVSLKETLDQRRSWFLMAAAALLTGLTIVMCVNAFCLCLRRQVRGLSKTKKRHSTLTKTASGKTKNFWLDSESMDPDDEILTLLSSDPLTTVQEDDQPEPEQDESGNSPTKQSRRIDPRANLQQELKRYEIAASLIKCKVSLSSIASNHDEVLDEEPGESSSSFVYFKAEYRRKLVALKTLSFSRPLEHNGGKQSREASTELWSFVQEIRLSSTLSHPQLIAFYGYVEMNAPASGQTNTASSEGLAMVMEYMSEGELNTFIQVHKRSLQQKQEELKHRPRRANTRERIKSLAKRLSWQDMAPDGLTSNSDSDNYSSEDGLGVSDDINSSGRWNWRTTSAVYKSKLSIAIEVAKAVQYLHSFSPPLFHGNLSSRKVFLDNGWNVKLGDLTCCSALRRWSSSHKHDGIAPPPDTAKSATRISEASSAISSEVHMDMTVWTAPEVLDGRQYTQKADIYSFGVLLAQLTSYECSSDEHSVMDDTEVPMLNNILQEHPPVDGEAPTPIRLLMFRCQAFQPEVRPTAEELLQELHQIEYDITEKS